MDADLSNKQGRLIKDLTPEDRPREKAVAGGIKSLSDAELMALLFATGIKGKSVIDLCNDILRDNRGHISLVTRMSVKELCQRYKGIGPAKAVTLLAALELGARSVADAQKIESPSIVSAKSAYNMMRYHFERLKHEEFWVMYLNRAGNVIKEERISQGGTAATIVDVKIILRYAIEHLAESMLLFHNHPSGNLTPSIEDDRLTKKITDAAKLVDIRVLDHIIISDNGFYSFADKGRI